jgi:putative ABC transport system permease protein
MIRPRWQKVLHDLAGDLTRSLLVVVSIAVGLFAIGVIVTLYAVISQDMRASYTQVAPANIFVQAGLFDQDLVDHIAHQPGVARAEGVRALSLRVLNAQGEWQAIDLKSYRDVAQAPINQLHLLEGAWPRKGEVVVDQHKLKDLGARVGGTLRIELPSGHTRDLKLSGVVQDLTVGAFSGGGGFFRAPVQAYLVWDTLDELEQTQTEQFNTLYVTVDGHGSDLAAIQALAGRVSHEFELNDVTVLSSKSISSYDHPNSSLIDAIVGVLLFLGLLVVFLSGFLVTNTLQALMTQQIQQVGIMKSVGARRLQIAGVYMALISVFGVLALAFAAPLAYVVAFRLLDFLASNLNFVLQGERLVPQALGLQAALALLMPQVAAWVPIWQGTHISVREALSGGRIALTTEAQRRRGTPRFFYFAAAAASSKTKNLCASWRLCASVVKGTSSRLISRPLLISVRNIFRHKGRLALTLLTLSLGGAVFISTFNVKVSLDQYIHRLSQYFMADVNITLDRPRRSAEVIQLLQTVPGVGRVEVWATARSELIQPDGSAGDRVQLLAPPAGSSLVQPIIIDGRWIEPGDRNAIVLSELFRLNNPGLRVGDTIRFHVNDKDTDWIVVGFYQMAGKNGGYSAYANYDYLAELTGQTYHALLLRVVGDHPDLTTAEQDRLSQAVEARLAENGIRIADLTTGAFLSGISAEGFAILTAFLLFLSVLTALVGSIGLAGTMSMNVMERTHEIGVLRAIGASDWTLIKMVMTEGVTIGAMSYVLGVALSFPITKILGDAISLAVFGAPSIFGFSATGFVAWLALLAVLAVLASMIPARTAARLTIREVLAHE